MKESPQERKRRMRETLKFIKTIKNSMEEFNDDLESDLKFYQKVLQLFQIGAWEESREVDFYLDENWYDVLGIDENEVVTLEHYYECIDDPDERERIMKSRETLKTQPRGTFWQEQFTLCGRRVKSFACIFENNTIIGGDLLIDNRAFSTQNK